MDLGTLRDAALWLVMFVAWVAALIMLSESGAIEWVYSALGAPWWVPFATLAVGGCVLIGWIAFGLVSNLLLLLTDHRDRDRT